MISRDAVLEVLRSAPRGRWCSPLWVAHQMKQMEKVKNVQTRLGEMVKTGEVRTQRSAWDRRYRLYQATTR